MVSSSIIQRHRSRMSWHRRTIQRDYNLIPVLLRLMVVQVLKTEWPLRSFHSTWICDRILCRTLWKKDSWQEQPSNHRLLFIEESCFEQTKKFYAFSISIAEKRSRIIEIIFILFLPFPRGKSTHHQSKQVHRLFSSLKTLTKNTEIVNPFQPYFAILLKKGKKRHVCLENFHFIEGTETEHLHLNPLYEILIFNEWRDDIFKKSQCCLCLFLLFFWRIGIKHAETRIWVQ